MINPSFFKNNRLKFAKQLENSSIAIFFSKDEIIKGDSIYFDFCDENLFYLTGIEQSQTKLIIHKNNQNKTQEYLFIQKKEKQKEVWEGEKLSKSQAKKISKTNEKNIYTIDRFEEILNQLLKQSKKIYLKEETKTKTTQKEQTKSTSSYKQFTKTIKRKYNKTKQIKNSTNILTQLREIKSKEEIKEIQKSIDITKQAFEEILNNKNKIKYEYEIEAILSYNYTKNNATHAFHPIVASDKNACTLHYIKNNQKIKRNSLILIDTGAQINNYKADITRTIPKNKKFNNRQKEVYQAVLNINKFAILQLKPNKNIQEFRKEVFEFTANQLIKLKLITEQQYQKDKQIAVKYILHSIGHFLGLDTHDQGDYQTKFKTGQVFTIEPGIYIQKENIGIRIEDNILITKNSNKNLSKNIPKEIEYVENIENHTH